MMLPVIYLLTTFAAVRQAAGVEIGQLPTEQHQVSGTLHVTGSRTLFIADFNYDGGGPDAFLYYYAPGQAVDRRGGGVIIPLPSSVGESGDGSFQRRRFTNEDFSVTLPDGTDVCDIGTLTVWCRPFQAIFTRIVIPRTIFVNSGADPCTLASPTTPPPTTPPPTTPPPTTPPPTTPPPTTPPPTTPPPTSGTTTSPTTSTGTPDTVPPTTSASTTSSSTTSTSPTLSSTTSASTTSPPTTAPTTMAATGIGIGQLPTEQHQVSGTLRVIDSRTLFFEGFNYDGEGPDAFLYYYAPGQAVDRLGGGVIIPLPSSIGESADGSFQMRRYTNEDFAVTLPDGTDVCDIGTLTIWCRPFRAIFTRIEIPRHIFLNNGADPCTLAMDGSISGTSIFVFVGSDEKSFLHIAVFPLLSNPWYTKSRTWKSCTAEGKVGATVTPPPLEFDNCIPLHETLQLSWRVDAHSSQVRFRMCGCQSLELGTNQYMGFGLSGSTTRTLMVGADPTIAWVDSMTSQAQAVDYHLSAYTQCRAGLGACPDTLDSSGTCTNDISDVSGSVADGKQCVSFTRPLSTSDSACDIAINPNQNQYIVWATGGLGVTAFKHFIRAEPGDDPIHLGRTPQDQCTGTQLVCRGCQPFVNERIVARSNAVFKAQIGPSGNERGYMGITGRPGWGISWYINDTLIPELIVERAKTYTFIIEGGTNPNDLSNYHPFYITDSIGGGRLQNTLVQQNHETVYAGFDENGHEMGVGRLCQLMETARSEFVRQSCHVLQPYITSLNSSCNSGDPGNLVWTPDQNTPDVVYYQCATHLNLGWKIIVLNEGEPIPPRAVIGEAPAFVASLWTVLSVAIVAFFGCC